MPPAFGPVLFLKSYPRDDMESGTRESIPRSCLVRSKIVFEVDVGLEILHLLYPSVISSKEKEIILAGFLGSKYFSKIYSRTGCFFERYSLLFLTSVMLFQEVIKWLPEYSGEFFECNYIDPTLTGLDL